MKDNRSFPRRPYLTPVFTTSLVFWGSCAFTFSSSRNATATLTGSLSFLGIVLCLLLVLLCVKCRKPLALLLCAALLAGMSLASAEATLLFAWSQSNRVLSLDDARIVLLQDVSENGYSPQALARVETAQGNSILAIVSFFNESRYLCGEEIRASGTISKADYRKNDYAWRSGASHVVTVKEAKESGGASILRLLIHFRKQALEALGSEDEHWSVLQALVCGYRTHIKETPLYACYQSCGLAHLVAVSGAHLVIVTGFASLLLKYLRVPRKASIAILIALMGMYVVIAGLPISALRAAIMSSVGVLSYIAKRRPSSLNALGIGIYAIVGTGPHASLSASLALSALSAMGIIVFSPLLERMLEHMLPKPASFVASSLALTLSAALPAQLYSCALFSQIPLISPVSNLACAPFFPLCCGLGLLGVLLSGISFPLGIPVLALAHGCTKALDYLVILLDGIPYGTVPMSIDITLSLLASFVLCGFVWALWEKVLDPRFFIGAFLVTVVAIASMALIPKPDCIAMLDVGQGDSFLLRSDGDTLLIDTGNKDSQLLDQLARLRVLHLDGVLITHSDDDHCGSLDAISRAVEVERIYVAQETFSCESESCKQLINQAFDITDDVCGLNVGDEFEIGKFSLEVLWPYSFVDEGGNADSLVLNVRYDEDSDGVSDVNALFTGDAESEQIHELAQRGALGKVDVLKVGHHGSAHSLTLDQALLLDPTIALIGVGKNNRYGHPTHEILESLDSVGSQIFRSDEDGGVELEMNKDHISARRF